MGNFYLEMVKSAGIGNDDTVLVVCGGEYDQKTLEDARIERVIISNVGHHAGVSVYGRFPWEYQDAENISHADKAFDWVLVHAGLHHCASPHRALCEMFRVARKGVLVVEARDSLLNKAAHFLGLVPEFEIEPVLLSDGKRGGIRNSPIPNYIYRWTEREVTKTVRSFDPAYRNEIEFRYGWRMPTQRAAMVKNPVTRVALSLANAAQPILKTSLPKQGNLFGFIIRKSDELQPWLYELNGEPVPNLLFMSSKYDRNRYR